MLDRGAATKTTIIANKRIIWNDIWMVMMTMDCQQCYTFVMFTWISVNIAVVMFSVFCALIDDFSLCSSVNVAKESKTLLDRDPRKQPEVPADFFRWVLTKLWSSISKISAKKTSWNWSNEAFYLTAVYKYYISLRIFFWCKLLSILLFLPRMPPSSQLCSAASLHRRGVFIS